VNVEKIIMKAKASGVKHCLIISPPPVCDSCKNGKPVSSGADMTCMGVKLLLPQ
jgi:hypothetical protein